MKPRTWIVFAMCLDWLVLSIAKATGFLVAPWWQVIAVPLYTLFTGLALVFAALVLGYLFLTARAVNFKPTENKENGITE
jgi:hypothetical protein